MNAPFCLPTPVSTSELKVSANPPPGSRDFFSQMHNQTFRTLRLDKRHDLMFHYVSMTQFDTAGQACRWAMEGVA
ncbi:hypothetical protein GCM10007973_32680 [Polymorphobacter multimanifer]|uniref:Uncharacterized protein n=1 Tax=Polymorphobacter multimanifer TaxID=1070431 RepID=A0A841LHT6_9SPHN|nr:hypothetical protein [Polymorphobacter multimanifer]MBB6228762.1 hypothetical protein [Polymorphobacter multimanifer]GGI93931.1 hypothetical protein GCM10007973_32680 [Polymorphobacter multimanifer]